MATVNSSSTDAQVEAAYDDNASYAEDGSVAKARAFLTAARILLRRLPQTSGTREANLEFRIDLIQKEIQQAQSWVAANGGGSSSAGGPRVTRVDFRSARG